MNKAPKLSKVVWYKSLGFYILFWFLLISLVPLLVLSYESNKISMEALKKAEFKDLKHSAALKTKFIDNWFYYRKIDISNWSQTKANIDFLSLLISEYKKSSKEPNEFVDSYRYIETITQYQDQLQKLVRQYDYIYDLFLIDNEGNILYSVAKEKDLGTNLKKGDSAKTKFAHSYSRTLQDGKIHFSDLELYGPSSNIVTGFLTAPMVDSKGKRIGVFAVQLKAERIASLFEDKNIYNSGLFNNYLISKDGLLISDIISNNNNNNNNNNTKVETSKLKEWYRLNSIKDSNQKEIISYENPFSQTVIGIHKTIDVFGVKWIIFNEVSQDSLHEVVQKVTYKTFIYFIITILLVVLISFIISRRIVKPLKELSSASIAYSNGKRDVKIERNYKGEVGVLVLAFTTMIESLQKNENKLKEQTLEVKKGLEELDEQKFALDSHSIVAVTDVKGDITYVNDRFIDISGYTKEELIGQNHRLLNSGVHSRKFWEVMYHMISHGHVWNDEVCNLNKNGEAYWVDTTIVPFMGEDAKPKSYIAIRTDITATKESELELIKANEIAQESVKAKSEFLATMSHEIRTPMNGVIGMLGLLMNSKLDDTQSHQASLAQSSAKALLTLINDILDFSKVDAGKMDLEHIDFNLRDELGEFAESIAIRAQEKDVELILDLTNVDLDIVNSDPGRIRQILTNIVGNSIKFTSQGYVLIKASLNKQDERKARLIFEITDTGIGIKSQKMETLFDSFSQVDASTTRKYGGTGLGLAIVKKLCSIMHGEVSAKSKHGEGSTFTVDIEVGISEKSSRVEPPFSLESKRALLVDSCKTNLDVMKNQLEHWGMEVFTAINEELGLEILNAKELDIVFIDMKMDELGEQIRKDSSFDSVRLIMMTRLNEREDLQKQAHRCFDAFFPKPVITKDLFYALSTLNENSSQFLKKEIITEQEYFNKNGNILLVEDNLTNQFVANGILDSYGLNADIANNGVEALDILNTSSKKYDIILMDCQMPELDGYDTTRAIREEKAGKEYLEIPIVAMTANAMQGDREKCEIAGMNDYITKPIEPEILMSVLNKYLADIETPEVVVENKIVKNLNWDEENALRRLGGSTKMLSKILEVFIDDIEGSVKALGDAIDAQDTEAIKLHAHSIKGSCGNINAQAMQEKAKEIELGLSELKEEMLREKFDSLKDMTSELLKTLADYLKNNNSETIERKISKLEIDKEIKIIKQELEQGLYIDTSSVNIFKASTEKETALKLKKLKKEINSFLTQEALMTIEDILQGL